MIDVGRSSWNTSWPRTTRGLLARRAGQIHAADVFAAKNTGHGYGGTRLPDDLELDPALAREAAKSLRLILDDEIRELALRAQGALTDLGLLSVKASMLSRGPVSLDQGEAAFVQAVTLVDLAMQAMAARIRTLATT